MGRCFFCRKECVAGTGVSFHRFPKEPSLKNRWIEKLKENMELKEDCNPKGAVLCSAHFEPKCCNNYFNRSSLKPGSIPTIFNNSDSKNAKIPPTQTQKEKVTEDKRETKTSGNIAHDQSSSVAQDSRVEDLRQNIQLSPDDKDKFNGSNPFNISLAVALLDHNYMFFLPSDSEPQFVHKDIIRKTKKGKSKRAKLSVHSFKDIINDLDNHCLMSESGLFCLEIFNDNPLELELFNRLVANANGVLRKEQYPKNVRGFALTLYFYSPIAYDYVRDTYNLELPHPNTLREWYMSTNCEPGFTEQAFIILKEESEKNKHKMICSLILDEIGIQKRISRGPDGVLRGYVDIGAGPAPFGIQPMAQSALVFMVVSLSSSWRIPVGYFLIEKLEPDAKANLIKECLIKLRVSGVTVSSLTIDGSHENKLSVEKLGVNFDVFGELKNFFPHPVVGEPNVNIILDPLQMLNHIRLCFNVCQVLVDGNNNQIKWEYIDRLNALQDTKGVKVGENLINFQQIRLNIGLDTDIFSSKVAYVIDYCDSILHLEGFEDSKSTSRFIQTIESIYNFLNIKNPFGKGTKCPLKQNNETLWRDRMLENIAYLSHIKNANGASVMNHSEFKFGFRGLYSNVLSAINIFDLFVKQRKELKYLLTYNLSKDNLKSSFSVMNSNKELPSHPTASQFIAIYKKILKSELQSSRIVV